jgi:hypothetical protein
MKFRTNPARYALLIGASVAIAACSSQEQQGALPQTPSSQAAQKVAGVRRAQTFTFQTIDNPLDKKWNVLFGINDAGTISGYYGTGSSKHPNQGYTVVPPYDGGSFTPENVPGATDTQVTCIDNLGNTGGFWDDSTGIIRGFIEWNGVFTTFQHGQSPWTEILGLNNAGKAVGFYLGKDQFHAFTLDEATGKFKPVNPPGATSVEATGINNLGDVVGFYPTSTGRVSFIEKNGVFSTLTYPNSQVTYAYGVNDHDAIVGVYFTPSVYHGFLLESPFSHAKFTTIDVPNSADTNIMGINNNGQMVGSYYKSDLSAVNGVLVSP